MDCYAVTITPTNYDLVAAFLLSDLEAAAVGAFFIEMVRNS